MQNNVCYVCGSDEFTVVDGAYVCNECGIQSQTVREVQVNYGENNRNGPDESENRDYEMTTGSQLSTNKKLLSWECFNLILLGLTQEVIELGAKPSLKITILQIWVQYLQVIEAAFISKKSKKFPKLNTSIIDTDGEILYGIKNLKKRLLGPKHVYKVRGKRVKLRTRTSVSANSMNQSNISSIPLSQGQQRYRINRRLGKLDLSLRTSNTDSIIMSDDISVLQRSLKSGKVKVKLSSSMKKALNSMDCESIPDDEKPILKNVQKSWENIKFKDKKNHLTLKKLITIIRLGLLINKDDIYLSDLLRWIYEGHLHVNRVNLFLPPNVHHSIPLSAMLRNTSRHSLHLELAMLLRYLQAERLPSIDFKKLADRFCDELQLPVGVTEFVCKLLLLIPPNMEFKRVLPDPEISVMSYILFAVKFLFCLDGISEEFSSTFADNVNRTNKIEDRLFCWNDYVKFIECRNAVVSKYNFLLHKQLYSSSIRNTQLFINDWNMMQSTLPVQKKYQLNNVFKDNTECLLKSLPNFERSQSYREIPHSIKPLTSTLKWIFDFHPMGLTENASSILRHDFTKADISYLTNEERLKNISRICRVPVDIKLDKPPHYIKRKNEKKDLSDPYSGKHLSTTAKVNVQLIDWPIERTQTKKIETLDFINKKQNSIYLGTGINYWSIHYKIKFLKNTNMTKINKVFDEQLPSSFLWFMQQCCRIVDCKSTQIYMGLIRVEKNFMNLSNKKTPDFGPKGHTSTTNQS